MRTSKPFRGLALAAALAGCLLGADPAAALCTATCGGTEECPQCTFSAFFSFVCISSACRWCATFECYMEAPAPAAGERLAALLPLAPAAAGGACSAPALPETGPDGAATVAVRWLPARL